MQKHQTNSTECTINTSSKCNVIKAYNCTPDLHVTFHSTLISASYVYIPDQHVSILMYILYIVLLYICSVVKQRAPRWMSKCPVGCINMYMYFHVNLYMYLCMLYPHEIKPLLTYLLTYYAVKFFLYKIRTNWWDRKPNIFLNSLIYKT